MKDLKKYGQYKHDFFNKIDFNFQAGKELLDVGCGDGSDIDILAIEFGLEVTGIDIYEHKDIAKRKCKSFKKASIFEIPFEENTFDYIFLHDILHHVDEEAQSYEKHTKCLLELQRVCKRGGKIIIAEANRYNPISYPHMVLMKKHNHFTQKYFKKILRDVFEDNVSFRTFEAHSYPRGTIGFFKIFEYLCEHIPICEPFRAYNMAIIENP